MVTLPCRKNDKSRGIQINITKTDSSAYCTNEIDEIDSDGECRGGLFSAVGRL